MNVLFLAVAMAPALASAAPGPTFGLLEDLFGEKKEKKEEKKEKFKEEEPSVLYIKPATYETHNTYQGYVAPSGYGAPSSPHGVVVSDSYGAPQYPILTDTNPYGTPVTRYGGYYIY